MHPPYRMQLDNLPTTRAIRRSALTLIGDPWPTPSSVCSPHAETEDNPQDEGRGGSARVDVRCVWWLQTTAAEQ